MNNSQIWMHFCIVYEVIFISSMHHISEMSQYPDEFRAPSLFYFSWKPRNLKYLSVYDFLTNNDIHQHLEQFLPSSQWYSLEKKRNLQIKFTQNLSFIIMTLNIKHKFRSHNWIKVLLSMIQRGWYCKYLHNMDENCLLFVIRIDPVVKWDETCSAGSVCANSTSIL